MWWTALSLWRDRAGVMLDCNDAYQQLFGLTRETLLGKTALDLEPLAPELRRSQHESNLRVMEEGLETTQQLSMPDGQGRLRDIRFQRRAIRDENNVVIGMLGVLTDITDQNRRERFERFRSRILEALATLTPDWVVGSDSQAFILQSIGAEVERMALRAGVDRDGADDVVVGHRGAGPTDAPVDAEAWSLRAWWQCRGPESRNPVFMIDEIDKMTGGGPNGDPLAAMLEVLDPSQNATFVDHYLNVPFDLSGVLFICTANSLLDIPAPLRDRMEVIRIAGYTVEEKVEIAWRYLLPRLFREHGITDHDLQFTDEALSLISNRYSREAGLRGFERKLVTLGPVLESGVVVTEGLAPGEKIVVSGAQQLLATEVLGSAPEE